MAKLYFKYGAMSSGKSIELLRVNYNYYENNKKTICLTSIKDDRYTVGYITSRIGISTGAIGFEKINIFDLVKKTEGVSCVLVDEAQFLTKEQVYQLSDVVDILDIPAICYGLRSDFKMYAFEGSKYLMSMADSIEEIKTICSVCKNKKAIVNARFKDGVIEKVGQQIQIGGNETYKPLCRKCYKSLLNV
jgi:thymidine kinase